MLGLPWGNEVDISDATFEVLGIIQDEGSLDVEIGLVPWRKIKVLWILADYEVKPEIFGG